MYVLFTYIRSFFLMVNVGKYTINPMDPMGHVEPYLLIPLQHQPLQKRLELCRGGELYEYVAALVWKPKRPQPAPNTGVMKLPI